MDIGSLIKRMKEKNELIFEGYIYSKVHQVNNGTVRWRCTNTNWPAKVYTSLKYIAVVNEKINEHNEHDQLNVERKLYSNKCKRKSQED
jgi:hypothetical protein